MKHWTFVDANTGALVGRTYYGPDGTLVANTPEGCVAVEGLHDHRVNRFDFDTRQVVPWRPDSPDSRAVWSDVHLRWVTLAERADAARARRAALIASCDWTQSADVPLSDEQRAAWRAYRQALRDVPSQADFPDAIDWPARPA